MHARSEAVPVDEEAIAVLPFRGHGASAELGYLAEGMMDVIAGELAGDIGVHALDPQRVLLAWQEWSRRRSSEVGPADAARFARRLGAGRVVVGEALGDRRALVLHASLLSSRDGRVLARVRAAGPADSLAVLLEQISARILFALASEPPPSDLAAGNVPLEAVRAYMRGQAQYRRGDYAGAAELFEWALERDSTFTPAALGLLRATRWGIREDRADRALRLLRMQDRRGLLTRSEKLVIRAIAAPPDGFGGALSRQLAAWEAALDARPYDPDIWYELGDLLLHWGGPLGRPAARERATGALRRAVALRPNFAPALAQLTEIAAAEGRIEEAKALLAALRDDEGFEPPVSDFLRWRIALAAGNARQLRELRSRFRQMHTESLVRIAGTGQLDRRGIADADAAALVLRDRTHPSAELVRLYGFLVALALNRGRQAEALRLLDEIRVFDPGEALRLGVLAALYGDGDPAAGQHAYEQLWSRLNPAAGTEPHASAGLDACVAEQWRLARSDPSTAQKTLRRILQAGTPEEQEHAGAHRWCAMMLEASLAVARDPARARPAVARLDSIRMADLIGPHLYPYDHLLIARLWERIGDPRAALAMARRRPDHHWLTPRFLAPALREEGRLAAATGDTAGGIRAYEHYLALRAGADPPLQPETERVRAALAVLRARGR